MQVFKAFQYFDVINSSIRNRVKELLASSGKVATLGVVVLGLDSQSLTYVKYKKRFCEEVGVQCEVLHLTESTDVASVKATIESFIKLNDNVIIQLPLPEWAGKDLLDLIPLEKDVDGLTHVYKNLYYSDKILTMPPVVRALNFFLETYGVSVRDKKCVVIGHGELVGRPIAHFLSSLGADVLIIEDYYKGRALEGDIFVLSTGIKDLIYPLDLPDGSIVVDFGASDLDMSSPQNLEHLKILSPSPGGMGPLVIRFLVMNVLGIR